MVDVVVLATPNENRGATAGFVAVVDDEVAPGFNV
jgi:hypothetical protein